MHVMVASGRLKDGVTQEDLLAASDRFQREFAAQQSGVLRRVLVADPVGNCADIVFFADEDTIRRVSDAEQHNDAYHHFMSTLNFSSVGVFQVLQDHQ